MAVTLTAGTWITMIIAIVFLWGVGAWALWRTMSDEDEKLELIESQGKIDTYSPKALAELREWIEDNPSDPLHDIAVERYNECVETLQEVDETFYDWSETQIQDFEKI